MAPEHTEPFGTWRQGDFTIGEIGFVWRTVKDKEGQDLEERSFPGFVVVTQTCDIVRSEEERPCVEISPLIRIDHPDRMHEIQRGYRPRFLYIPGAVEHDYVADLDWTMTLHKSRLSECQRYGGTRSDPERRGLAVGLARKSSRFAFPDDFNSLVAPLQRRIKSKHERNSEQGSFLRALDEIRVTATPSWDALEVRLMFWFIYSSSMMAHVGQNQTEDWLSLMAPTGRFVDIDGDLVALKTMSAREYVDSDRLDLDYLSSR